MATRTEDRSDELDAAQLLEDRDHKSGCPASRVEQYRTVRPATDTSPAQPLLVTRCVDCAGHSVKPID